MVHTSSRRTARATAAAARGQHRPPHPRRRDESTLPQSKEHAVSGPEGPIVRVLGLRKDYGAGAGLVRAVDGVDLDVARGEALAVMGPSGCGKSTLLHLLGGLDRPTAGEL